MKQVKTLGEIVLQVSVERPELDAWMEKVDRMRALLEEAKALAGDLASCKIKVLASVED